jgi:EAL domain-containing protein (putative c-di-GMP-specific phosphodiesterase class I)
MFLVRDDHPDDAPSDVIEEALEAVRLHLGMDVAYVSESGPDTVVFRHVAGVDVDNYLKVGLTIPACDIFCNRIAEGDFPCAIRDTSAVPVLKDLAFIRDANVAAFVTVPIRRSTGENYGMFCCYAHTPRPEISERDLNTVSMFAKLTTRSINQHFDAQHEIKTLNAQLSQAMQKDGFSIHLQPIVSLSDGRPMAAEALSRFSQYPSLGPEWWFAQAQRTDMQIELEVAAISKALMFLDDMPDRTYLSVNASPQTVSSPLFMDAIAGVPADRLLVELTEREIILETAKLLKSLSVLRDKRIGIAIDDVGAGYAGLNTIVSLKPNVLKLVRSLVSQIHECTVKQSLTKAMVHFANEMSAFLVAEGVETIAEHKTLRSLGVRLGQGFFYARPAEAAIAVQRMNDFQPSKTGVLNAPTLRSAS